MSDQRVLSASIEKLQKYQVLSEEASGFIPAPMEKLLALLEYCNPSYADRVDAEKDESRKQLIPYVVVVSGGKILSYWRSSEAAEQRLHGKRSIGFGGHVDEDADGTSAFAFFNGLYRELEEELELPETYKTQFLGFVNNDDTPVGRVHLGVVYAIHVAHATPRAAEIGPHEWVSVHTLRQQIDAFEGWSQLLLSDDRFVEAVCGKKPRKVFQFCPPGHTVMYSPKRDLAYMGPAILRSCLQSMDMKSRYYWHPALVTFATVAGRPVEQFEQEVLSVLERIDSALSRCCEEQKAAFDFLEVLEQAGLATQGWATYYVLLQLGAMMLGGMVAGVRDIHELGSEVEFDQLIRDASISVAAATAGLKPYEAAVTELRLALKNARDKDVNFEVIDALVKETRLALR